MKKKILFALVGVIVIVLAWLAGRVSSTTLSTNPQPTVSVATCEHSELNRDNIMLLVNEYRLANNLPTLKRLDQLDQFAEARAGEINVNDKFTHETAIGPLGKWEDNNLDKKDRFSFKGVGELLARSGDSRATACGAVDSWKTSPTHNDIMLSPEYSLLGIGVEKGTVVVEAVGLPSATSSPNTTSSPVVGQ